MNLAKKIKLALLTSAVMLSSKGSYAMQDERDDLRNSVGCSSSCSTKPSPTGLTQPQSSTVLMPLNSAVRSMISRTTDLEFYIDADVQDEVNLQNAIGTVSPDELRARLDAIEGNLLKKLAPAFSLGFNPRLINAYYRTVAQALPFSSDQIIARGNALNNMVEELFIYFSAGRGEAPSELTPHQKQHVFFTFFCRSLFSGTELIDDVFKLEASQIKEITNTLKESKDHLSPEKAQNREIVVQFLFMKIWDRVEAIKTLQPTLSSPSSSVPSSSSSTGSSTSYQHDNMFTPHPFRTTGVNPKAKMKHSAIAIQLPNKEMQGSAYRLIINHRTTEKGPMVRVYNPNTKTYIELGTLPASSSGFCNTIFDFFPLAEALRKNSPLESVISTYLSFMGGISDVHSFTIQSGGKTLKEVIFGDKDSELQPGIHVYAPETDGDAHEWSRAKPVGV